MAEPILPELSETEARSRFDELLDRAERGELFIITRNGRPVATFGPPCGEAVWKPAAADPRGFP